MRDKPGRHGKACKALRQPRPHLARNVFADRIDRFISAAREPFVMIGAPLRDQIDELPIYGHANGPAVPRLRSEEHTSELQSLMRISSAVFSVQNTNTVT